jgi:hypothetical protein
LARRRLAALAELLRGVDATREYLGAEAERWAAVAGGRSKTRRRA